MNTKLGQWPDYDEEQAELASDLVWVLNKNLIVRGLNIAIHADDILEAMGKDMYLTWVPEEYR